MAEEEKAQEKTHEPTEKRRKEFRDKGQVPRSKEVLAVVGLAVGAGTLLATGPLMAEGLGQVFVLSYAHAARPTLALGDVLELGGWLMWATLGLLAAPLGAIWLSTAVVGGIQGRGAVPKEPIKIDWEKVNPAAGFKRQFLSSQPLVELVKGLSKLGILAWLVWTALETQVGLLPALIQDHPLSVLMACKEMAWLIIGRAVPLGIAVAILDYGHQWWQLQEQMRMTREEMKDEQKLSDGDPHVKNRRRQRMKQLATAQNLAAVDSADVVITNPTHYAVALKYDPDVSAAPIVVAKGVDHLALRIRQAAARKDIPTVENRPLARALYAQADPGQEIPEDLYAAVAQILALIWRKRAAKGGSRR